MSTIEIIIISFAGIIIFLALWGYVTSNGDSSKYSYKNSDKKPERDSYKTWFVVKNDPNHKHIYSNGECTICHAKCNHKFICGDCIICGMKDPNHRHVYSNGVCMICYAKCNHNIIGGKCSICGKIDPYHRHVYSNGKCNICGMIDPYHKHIYYGNKCKICGHFMQEAKDNKISYNREEKITLRCPGNNCSLCNRDKCLNEK